MTPHPLVGAARRAARQAIVKSIFDVPLAALPTAAQRDAAIAALIRAALTGSTEAAEERLRAMIPTRD